MYVLLSTLQVLYVFMQQKDEHSFTHNVCESFSLSRKQANPLKLYTRKQRNSY